MIHVAVLETEFTSLAKHILHQAKRQGVEAAEVKICHDKSTSVSARMGAVETVEQHFDRSLSITVYWNGCSGTASTSDLGADALEQTLQKACYIARYTQPDPCSGLADRDRLAFEYPNLDLYHPWSLSTEDAIEQALRCEALAMEQDPRITNSEGVSVDTCDSYRLYANSHGFIGGYPDTCHSISCVLLAEAGDDKQRDYDYTSARRPKDLGSIEQLADRVAKRVVQRLGARRIKTCEVPILLDAPLARGLISHFISAISGGHLYRQASFLVDHLGKPVFPSFITIDQRPHLTAGLGSAPFDQEGVRTTDRDFVVDGVVQSYVLGSYSARKLGLETTGNAGGVHNVFVSHGSCSQTELIKKMGKGLFVTELIGQGVNLVTGDYSRGAFGYWVEQGEIQYPVKQVTIAGHLKDMFAGIVDIGKDIDKRGNIRVGSVLINKMTVGA